MKEDKIEKAELLSKTLITLVVIVLAFVLFWAKREGGAYFVGLISGSPLAAAGAYAARKFAPALNTSNAPNASTAPPGASQGDTQMTVATQTTVTAAQTEGSGQ